MSFFDDIGGAIGDAASGVADAVTNPIQTVEAVPGLAVNTAYGFVHLNALGAGALLSGAGFVTGSSALTGAGSTIASADIGLAKNLNNNPGASIQILQGTAALATGNVPGGASQILGGLSNAESPHPVSSGASGLLGSPQSALYGAPMDREASPPGDWVAAFLGDDGQGTVNPASIDALAAQGESIQQIAQAVSPVSNVQATQDTTALAVYRQQSANDVQDQTTRILGGIAKLPVFRTIQPSLTGAGSLYE